MAMTGLPVRQKGVCCELELPAGLVESEKRGLWIYYRLRPDLAPERIRLIDSLVAGGPGTALG